MPETVEGRGRKPGGLLRHYAGAVVHHTLWHYRTRLRMRAHPARWLADLDRVKIDRPVILLGTQGGGLTFVSRLLRRNSKVVSISGDHRFWSGPDEMQKELEDQLPPELCRAGRVEERHHEFGTLRHWLYATDELLPEYRLTADDCADELAEPLRKWIKLATVIHGGRAGGSRFLDKSQSFTLKIPFLERALKGCSPKYILITRNPYAVCRRAVERIFDFEASRERKFELAAQHWANSMRIALEDGEKCENFLTVQFEDVLEDVETSVRELCEFTELEFDRRMIPSPDDRRPIGTARDHKWYPVRPDVNDRYLNDLDARDVAVMEPHVGELARRFGYSLEK